MRHRTSAESAAAFLKLRGHQPPEGARPKSRRGSRFIDGKLVWFTTPGPMYEPIARVPPLEAPARIARIFPPPPAPPPEMTALERKQARLREVERVRAGVLEDLAASSTHAEFTARRIARARRELGRK